MEEYTTKVTIYIGIYQQFIFHSYKSLCLWETKCKNMGNKNHWKNSALYLLHEQGIYIFIPIHVTKLKIPEHQEREQQ